jgi:hypothetical protein
LEISDRVIEKLKSRRVLSVVFYVWDRWWVNGGISNYTSVYLRERHKPVYRDTTGISIYIIIYILGCIESTIVENCEVVRNVMDNFDSFGFTTKLKKNVFFTFEIIGPCSLNNLCTVWVKRIGIHKNCGMFAIKPSFLGVNFFGAHN